jgi:hypothetical protein
MKKDEWLQQVKEQLKGLPSEAREKVLDHYEELFLITKANGKEEEEVTEAMNHSHLAVEHNKPVKRIEPHRMLIIVYLMAAVVSIITGMGLKTVLTYSPTIGWTLGILFMATASFYAAKSW